jgi:hypothetical protein
VLLLLAAAAERIDVLVVARSARLGEGGAGRDRDGEDGEQSGNTAAYRHERGF